MFKPKNSLLLLALGALFVAFIIFSPLIVNKIFAQAPMTSTLTGWAWSSNIGWICFKDPTSCPQAVVTLTGNTFSGEAWSSNIGWIKFNPGPGPDGYPDDVASRHDVSLSGSSLIGWARACSVFVSGCTGTLKLPEYRGGWDGWLKLGGGTLPGGGVSLIGKQLTGYAWGDLILGWVKFDGVFNNGNCTGVCVDNTTFSAQCLINGMPLKVGDYVDFSIVTANGSPLYTYDWKITGPGISPGTGFEGVEEGWNIGTYTYNAQWPQAYPVAGNYTLLATVTDGNANNGDATCSTNFDVTNNTQPRLTVNVTGSGSVTSNPGGISGCTNSCNANFPNNSTVTLTATPSANGKFKNWTGGDCVSTTPIDPDTGVSTCTVNMGTTNKAVTANFDEVQKFRLSIGYPSGNSMVVNSRSPIPGPSLDVAHQSSDANIIITKFDQAVPLPNIDFNLKLTSLISRIPVDAIPPYNSLPTASIITDPNFPPTASERRYKLHINFPTDAQPKENTASPYAGNYRLTFTAVPTDGSKTLTAPVNFSYIDSREVEQ
ncbi:MAG: hypothetical protein Q7T49_02710 [bacterium]|nr:hypothetical protein [bacterium]